MIHVSEVIRLGGIMIMVFNGGNKGRVRAHGRANNIITT